MYPRTMLCNFTGRISSPKILMPWGGAPSQTARSVAFGTVAETAMYLMEEIGYPESSGLDATSLILETTPASKVLPRVSLSKWTSSMSNKPTWLKKRMPPRSLCRLVIASNFSGVVHMISVASIPAKSSCSVSPVVWKDAFFGTIGRPGKRGGVQSTHKRHSTHQ